jgi:hypothetical protein
MATRSVGGTVQDDVAAWFDRRIIAFIDGSRKSRLARENVRIDRWRLLRGKVL